MAAPLAGKKTYVTAALGFLGALAGWLTGEMALADAAQIAITSILGATIRAGMPK